jgi:hypothetical protein
LRVAVDKDAIAGIGETGGLSLSSLSRFPSFLSLGYPLRESEEAVVGPNLPSYSRDAFRADIVLPAVSLTSLLVASSLSFATNEIAASTVM